MKLFKKIEAVLDRYKYMRYYFSNLLTLIRMLEANLLHRVDLLTHKAVGDLQQLHTLLTENQVRFTIKGKTYIELANQLSKVSNTVSDLLSELSKKNIVDHKDPLLSYFITMADHTSGIYRDIDKIIEKVGGEKLQQMRIGNEIAGMFWLTDLKSKYIIHVAEVWDKLIKYLKKYGFYLPILSEFNQITICDSLDPNKQYFVAVNDLSSVFKNLTQPTNIEKLYEQTTVSKPLHQVKQAQRLASNLKLRFRNKLDIKSNLHHNDLIEVNVDQVILSDGKVAKNTFSNITRFGGDSHNQILLKHECISRNQFIIISEHPTDFYIVCTSPTNSTRIVYTHPVLLKQQMLIKLGKGDLFNIQKIRKHEEEVISQQNELADNQTVTHLPTRSKVEVSQLHVEILTGKWKDRVVVLRQIGQQQALFTFGRAKEDHIPCEVQAEIRAEAGQFKISNHAEVLLKTATQYNGLRPSRKTKLGAGDKVYAQEFEFEVEG